MNLTKLHKQAIVRAIMLDTPAIDRAKRAEEIKAAIVKAMSPAVKRMYETKPEALRTRAVAYADAYRDWSCECVVGDVTTNKIDEIIAPYQKQEEERAQTRRRLEDAFAGIRTVKQAIATFPEFQKYYPTEAQPTKNLPALANVVADLSKLGWPKGEKQ